MSDYVGTRWSPGRRETQIAFLTTAWVEGLSGHTFRRTPWGLPSPSRRRTSFAPTWSRPLSPAPTQSQGPCWRRTLPCSWGGHDPTQPGDLRNHLTCGQASLAHRYDGTGHQPPRRRSAPKPPLRLSPIWRVPDFSCKGFAVMSLNYRGFHHETRKQLIWLGIRQQHQYSCYVYCMTRHSYFVRQYCYTWRSPDPLFYFLKYRFRECGTGSSHHHPGMVCVSDCCAVQVLKDDEILEHQVPKRVFQDHIGSSQDMKRNRTVFENNDTVLWCLFSQLELWIPASMSTTTLNSEKVTFLAQRQTKLKFMTAACCRVAASRRIQSCRNCPEWPKLGGWETLAKPTGQPEVGSSDSGDTALERCG